MYQTSDFSWRDLYRGPGLSRVPILEAEQAGNLFFSVSALRNGNERTVGTYPTVQEAIDAARSTEGVIVKVSAHHRGYLMDDGEIYYSYRGEETVKDDDWIRSIAREWKQVKA